MTQTRNRSIMKKDLLMLEASAEKAGLKLNTMVNLSNDKKLELGKMLWQAFQGTEDDQGETLEEMKQEVAETFSGKYGELLEEHSFIVMDASGHIEAAAMVTAFRKRLPLLVYLATAPEARKQGLAGVLLKTAAASLASMKYDELYLVVSNQNSAARNIYKHAGFVDVGTDWAEVLKNKKMEMGK
ncbi:GNAT family N-acetyltransferase [Enterococcus sp. LJL128]|uniref:GNAT family N-acetyltransferase n=1 Tax=Enterococcus sp. LJL51 TaxID=3416656 RepID=UPI003CF7E800